jgi:hypothetical protein
MARSKTSQVQRQQASADEIALHLKKYTAVVPGLEKVTIEVVRLAAPDTDGCNWMAKHSRIPPGCLPESVRLFYDIIQNAQSHFNLWDLH